MDVKTLHPDLTSARLAEWILMRDAAAGEGAVKARGEAYLPKPSGFKTRPDGGKAMYDAYRMRAQFPEILAPSISAMVGIIHDSESRVELPGALDFIIERATENGLTLDAFHRRITRQLLEVGRYGVLADAPEGAGQPFLVGYGAEVIINWDADGTFFVLDETQLVRDGFEWIEFSRFRVLELIEGRYIQTVFEGPDLVPTEILPEGVGALALEVVPFVVATSRDLTPVPEPPPLVGVGRAAVAIYQLSADYRHQLYMSGQETLVIINGKVPDAIGAGVVIELEGTESRKPDAKYVGPSGVGIEAHKVAIEQNLKASVRAGARMFDQTESRQESGEARRLRFAAETATLMSVAQNSCAALEASLRHVAVMVGADPKQVVVAPPTDLLDSTMSPDDAVKLVKVWQEGAISYETLYAAFQRGGLADIDRTHEEESKLIDDENEQLTPEVAGLLPLPADDVRDN